MDLGLVTFPTDYSIPVADLAVAAEERGFESLFLTEHTHIPVSRRTPYPAGGELPREYLHTLDPFVALGAVAAVTRRLRFGTGICLITERDPIVTAKVVATIDHLAGGRFDFGIGAGWNAEEMLNHGTDPTRRWAVTRERIAAMRQIWSEDEAEFHGEFVDFDPLWSWPKPTSGRAVATGRTAAAGPPVLIGGTGPRALDRVIEYGDGWLPIDAQIQRNAAQRIADLQARLAAAGRGPLPVTVFGVAPEPGRITELAAAGANRGLLLVPSMGTSETLRLLDGLADLIPRADPGAGLGALASPGRTRGRGPVSPFS